MYQIKIVYTEFIVVFHFEGYDKYQIIVCIIYILMLALTFNARNLIC